MVFEFLYGLLPAQFQMLGKSVDVIAHLGQQFLLGDAADTGIRLIHAHVGDIVQLAEDAQLRELRDARQEDETEHRLISFQRTIEVAHRVAELIEFLLLMRHIQQRCVIFINEHHHLLARLPVNHFYQVIESIVVSVTVIFYTILLFIIFQKVAQILFQLRLLHVLALAQVEVQHGIFVPLLLQLLDGKPLEEFLLALEITLKGRNQQRLAETAWSAQEEIRSIGMGHTIDVFRLIYIELVLLADTFKCLNSYRI